MKHKVIVFGLDGVRLDTLRAAATPHLDAIAAAGFLTACRVPEVNATISGPCWATIATGVCSDEHRITGNNLRFNRLRRFPCFLRQAAAHGATTYAAAGWLPLLTRTHGGPIFAADHQYVPPRPRNSKNGGDAISDADVAACASKTIASDDIDAAFVYFGQVDHAGHEHGVDAAYTRALVNADACVGEVVAAVSSRATFGEESWTFIAVTDHGHRDAGGHGGDSTAERTAWLAAGGPGVAGVEPAGLGHVDVPRLVLGALGFV
ncbi:MAG TPA: alkaline phosphatase family protein [Stackebrandtia sp.]|jgi:predicted AlkP superfamily pyrophosphatase or phosphodiesterase|uniref:alkaline phosphatase family protein n=1 Tax=Stackebrandtia sp. TaxID=2023065 RepID=UPI002D27E1ED|nr:alkaline phosphatase family protein [Stackebrandtia sp.]HZE38405.1 alkaline phosphatase family protein [Stackebrandtia sp.]